MFTFFNIPTGEFTSIMLIPFAISITLITLCCFFIPAKELKLEHKSGYTLDIPRAFIYTLLFIFSIAIVFRTIPYYIGLIIIPAVLAVMDIKSLKKVDYPLLLTFCAFFVFSGNMARIPAVDSFLKSLIDKNTLLYGVLSCQFISNVPSAILLSKFTENYAQLLVAVNIGGAGTLIASLASLITFREYTKHEPKKKLMYIKQFSAYNFGILSILFVVMSFVFRV